MGLDVARRVCEGVVALCQVMEAEGVDLGGFLHVEDRVRIVERGDRLQS